MGAISRSHLSALDCGGGRRRRVGRLSRTRQRGTGRADVAVPSSDCGRRADRAASRDRAAPGHRSDIPRRLRAAWRTPASAIARLAFLGTRPAILLVGYFAVITLGYSNNGRPPLRFVDNEFLNLQGKWDTAWYMSVVTDGYRYRTHDVNEQQNIVFFPGAPGCDSRRRPVFRRIVAGVLVGRHDGRARGVFLVARLHLSSRSRVHRRRRFGALGGVGDRDLSRSRCSSARCIASRFSCSVRPARSIIFAVANW